MEGTEWWEEAIDVDDSDLPSLLQPLPTISSSSKPLTNPNSLPPLQPCSQLRPSSQTLTLTASQPRPLTPDPVAEESPPLQPQPRSTFRPIPGPAGAVQTAMHRRAQQPHTDSCFDAEAREDRMDDVIEEEEDEDFKLNPWLCAMQSLGLAPDSTVQSPISSIKALRSTTGRIPQVVGIIASCTPNGLGGLSITMKDPTGTIGASVHHKVLLESNLDGDISVGCALILKQVVVFSPGRSTCYLNVTAGNLVKLIGKDCGPPHKQMLASLTSRCSISENYIVDGLGTLERSLHPEKMMNVGNRNLIRNFRGSINPSAMTTTMTANANHKTREHMEIDPGEAVEIAPSSRHITEVAANEAGRRSFSCETIGNRKMFLSGSISNTPTGEHINVVLGPAERAPSVQHSAEANATDLTRENSNCGRMINGRKRGPDGSLECSISVAAASTNSSSGFAHRTTEPKKIIPKVSVAQWTDEQLTELFSDYPEF